MTLPAVARCPVCGAALAADPWRCPRCETPHHAECAQYFGGCAVFACRDGHLPAAMEVASWPASLQTLQALAAMERWQVRLLGGLVVSSVVGTLPLVLPWGPVGLLPFSLIPGAWIAAVACFYIGSLLHSRALTMRAELVARIGAEDVERTLTAFRRARDLLPARLPRSRLWALTGSGPIIAFALLLIPLEILAFTSGWVWAGALVFFGGMFSLFALISLNAIRESRQQMEFLARAIEGRTLPQAQLEAKPADPAKPAP